MLRIFKAYTFPVLFSLASWVGVDREREREREREGERESKCAYSIKCAYMCIDPNNNNSLFVNPPTGSSHHTSYLDMNSHLV